MSKTKNKSDTIERRRKTGTAVGDDIDLSRAVVWNSNALLEAQCVHVRTLL